MKSTKLSTTKIKQVILKIVKELDKNQIDYFITGGTALLLKGIIKETKDVDFFVNYKDFTKLKKIFAEYIVPSEKKEKNYLNLIISETDVEFVGISSIYNKESYLFLKNKDYDTIKIQNHKVNISSLLALLECYKFAYNKYKKEKHLKKIELIKNYLEYEKISKQFKSKQINKKIYK